MVSFLALLPRSLTTFLYSVAALLRFYGNTDTIPISRIPLTILDWSLVAFALGTASLLANLGLEWNTGNRSRNQAIEARERETRRDHLADEERNKADRERERAEKERLRAENERIRSRQRAEDERQRAENERIQSRQRAEEERLRAENERIQSRQREARQDYLADEERNRAAEERERARRREDRQDRQDYLADEERNRANKERNKADRERDQANRERERASSRARIQNRFTLLQIRHQLTPSAATQAALADFLSFLEEYGE